MSKTISCETFRIAKNQNCRKIFEIPLIDSKYSVHVLDY